MEAAALASLIHANLVAQLVEIAMADTPPPSSLAAPLPLVLDLLYVKFHVFKTLAKSELEELWGLAFYLHFQLNAVDCLLDVDHALMSVPRKDLVELLDLQHSVVDPLLVATQMELMPKLRKLLKVKEYSNVIIIFFPS